jgi:hypothetical protein
MQTLNHQNCTLIMGLICAVITLSACKGAQEAAGWHRTAPDAASIQPLRALEIPPGFEDTPSDRPEPTKTQSAARKPSAPAATPRESDRAEESLLEHVQPHPQ